LETHKNVRLGDLAEGGGGGKKRALVERFRKKAKTPPRGRKGGGLFSPMKRHPKAIREKK